MEMHTYVYVELKNYPHFPLHVAHVIFFLLTPSPRTTAGSNWIERKPIWECHSSIFCALQLTPKTLSSFASQHAANIWISLQILTRWQNLNRIMFFKYAKWWESIGWIFYELEQVCGVNFLIFTSEFWTKMTIWQFLCCSNSPLCFVATRPRPKSNPNRPFLHIACFKSSHK